MNVRGLCWVGIALLAVPGCVVERKEFDALREQVLLQQRIMNDLKARQEEQVLRVDAVNNGFRILGDKAEENSRRLDDLVDLVGEVGVAPAPVAAAPPAPPPRAVEPPAPILLTNRPAAAAPAPVAAARPAPEAGAGERVITASAQPDKVYVRALQTFNRKDYGNAVEQFRGFLAAFPDHILAGNAQYWIGECFYTQKRFEEAAEEFAKVGRLYPSHRKIPDALLKRGLSLRELRRTAEAKAALEEILAKHPRSEAAPKAREYLDRWN